MPDPTPERRMKEAILKDWPRMKADDDFRFACGPNLPCYNRCCADVNIVLTPYDILRLKNRLEISSEEFLEKYTLLPFTKEQRLPVVLLRMNDDEGKTCPFVREAGCSVYEDRPWACRMYPVGAASPKDEEQQGPAFYFLVKDEVCKGFEQARTWTVREWMKNQGVDEYDELGELFKEITLHDYFQKGGVLDPKRMEMYHTVCCDLDRFRRFVFKSSFLEKFEVDEATVEKMRDDDIELLKFGFRWLKFCLFREPTMTVRPAVAETKRREDEALLRGGRPTAKE